MKIFCILFSLILLSSCSIFEDEVFSNTHSETMLEDGVIDDKNLHLSAFLERYSLLKEKRLKYQMNITKS